jgi:hypothetical protein
MIDTSNYGMAGLSALGYRLAEWLDIWPRKPSIYTQKSTLKDFFTQSGMLIQPLSIRLSGCTDGIYPLLEQCRLSYESQPATEGFSVLQLNADTK